MSVGMQASNVFCRASMAWELEKPMAGVTMSLDELYRFWRSRNSGPLVSVILTSVERGTELPVSFFT